MLTTRTINLLILLMSAHSRFDCAFFQICLFIDIYTRACLKKAFRELRVPVCGRFYPNEGGVAGYGNRMRVKYTAKWGLQIAEMIFQTRSSTFFLHTKACNGVSKTGKRCQFFLRL